METKPERIHSDTLTRAAAIRGICPVPLRVGRPAGPMVMAAGLAVLILCNAPALRAMIVGPYVPDAHTLQLWHFDESAPPMTNAVAGGLELTVLGGGAVLTNVSYPGFGGSLSTYDGGPDATAGTDRDAYAAPRTLVNGGGDNVTVAYADQTTGAFTIEALVRIDFDPNLNYGPVANGGNGRGAPMQIVTGEDEANGGRIFQFRIVPIGVINNNPYIYLEFINVHQAVSPIENITVPIPTDGPDAIQQGQWYHVAVTYNGSEGMPDNLRFYWTRMDPDRTEANLIGTWTMIKDLPVAPTDFVVGNIGRNPSQNNFVGLIDEVRISSIARPANGMMFAPPLPVVVTQPEPQTVAVGQSFTLSAAAAGQPPLFYQWERDGQPIAGATREVYTVAVATPDDAGTYRLAVSNAAGVVYSDPVTVTVRNPNTLVWTPLASWTWNFTDVNWDSNQDNQADTAFAGGDRVVFNDAGLYAPVAYVEAPVNPSEIRVNTVGEYELTTFSGAALVNRTHIIKEGSGTLTLDVDHLGEGVTEIRDGVLQVGAGMSSRGSLPAGPITNQATLVFNRTGTLDVPGPVHGAGTLINSNTGTVRLLGTNGLAADAQVIIDRGTLIFGPAALGAVTQVMVRPFGPLLGSILGLTGGAVVGSNVTVRLASTNWSDGISTYDWRSSIWAEAGSNTVHARLYLEGNNTIFLSQEAGAWLEVDGPVEGPDFTYQFAMRGNGEGLLRSVVNLPRGALAKTDGGVWTVAGDGNASTYEYVLIVGGRLAIGNDGALHPHAYLRLGNGVFDLAGFNQTVSGLSNETSGVRLIANSSTNRDSILTVATDRSWVFDGQIADSTAGGTRIVGLTLRAAGDASLTFTTAQPYSGPTRVEAGRLVLLGEAALPNTVSLWFGPGATLDASGRSDAAFTIAPHQTLSGAGTISVSGNLTNAGTMELHVGKTNGVVSATRLVVSGHLQHAGSLRLVLQGEPLAAGDAMVLFSSASAAGAWTGIEPAVPGPGLQWDTTTLLTDGTLRVVPGETPEPVIGTVRWEGSQFFLSGSGAPAGSTFTVLASPDVTRPVDEWTPVATGSVEPDGTFRIALPVLADQPVMFYRLRLP